MAGMNEIMGELIQMNSHMVMRDLDKMMMCAGIIGAAIMLISAIASIVSKDKKTAAICAGVMVIAIVAAIVGANQPRVKEIRACANGPISLEQVADVYDIKNIDGKELTLWVKQ